MSSELTVVGTCPLDCPDACSWIVTVQDGVATKLRGNTDHPFTQGGLCKKVNPWLTYAADPSRLMTPLRRVGPKGPGARFEPMSWDDALATIAGRVLDARDEFGGESVWPFVGTGHMGWIQGASGEPGARLWNLLGSSHHSLSICSPSGHLGLGYSVGTSVSIDPEDVVHSGLILIWGSNTLITNQHFWPFVQQAKDAGVPVVVIDPARTRTAERADLHLSPRPGTDGALALGLCRALVDRDAHNAAFLAERTLGADDFLASLDHWDRTATLAECDVDPDGFDALVELLTAADRGPLAIKLGHGMQRHTYGGQAARVVSCLPALTGSYGERGGGLVYSTGGAYGLNSFKRQRPDLRPGPVRTLAMTKLGQYLLDLDDPPVKVLMISGANPVVSNPQIALVRAGLARDDLFTVVTDLYLTETADYADIVLPSAMQHEQIDITESFAHLYLNWNEPAVEPPGECLTSTEIHRRLAAVMAERDDRFAEPLLQATDLELAADALDNETYRGGVTSDGSGCDSVGGATAMVERLRSEGFIRIPGTEHYLPVSERFPTASGYFEFASSRAEADGHGLLPNYRAPAEPALGEGEYALVARGSDWHINSVFAGTEKTLSRTGAPSVTLHAADAERDGVSEGDTIRLWNERGSFTAEAHVNGAARRGVITTTKGWWRQGLNATVIEKDSDMGEGAVYHDNRVRIAKVAQSTSTDQSTGIDPSTGTEMANDEIRGEEINS